MPHGESWFSLLPFHERFKHVAASLFGLEDGKTLMDATPGVQHVYGAIFVLCLIALVAVVTETSIRNAGDLLPHERLTLRNFMELMVGTAYKMMSDIMGPKAARYFLPMIGTFAVFILLSNALGLVPGFLPATDNLNITLACGVVVFVATHVYGLKENGFDHIKHLFGPVIGWKWLPLMILMFFIETISHLARPVSLAIRLMANMTADHMVLTIFLALLPWWLPVPVAMYVLGTIVVIVQTLVFCLLSTVYIAMAIEHAEH